MNSLERYFIFYIKMYESCQLIPQKVVNQKEFCCNVLKSSQNQLQNIQKIEIFI